MKNDCQFLRPGRFSREPRCTIGINFASAGPDRERCRLCPLAELDYLPLCPSVDVYARLTGGASIAARVEI